MLVLKHLGIHFSYQYCQICCQLLLSKMNAGTFACRKKLLVHPCKIIVLLCPKVLLCSANLPLAAFSSQGCTGFCNHFNPQESKAGGWTLHILSGCTGRPVVGLFIFSLAAQGDQWLDSSCSLWLHRETSG